MPEVTDADRRRIYEEVRLDNIAKRKRVRPEYTTISVKEAKERRYRPITSAYRTRQFDQCAMLDHVIHDFRDSDIVLVRVGRAKNQIEVWRKIYEPEKSTTGRRQSPRELVDFVAGMLPA